MGNLSVVVKGIFLLNNVMASNGKGIHTGFTLPRRIFTYPLALIFSPVEKKWGEHDVPLDDVLQGGRDAILQGVAPPPVHLPLRAEVLQEVLISDKGTEALLVHSRVEL